MKSMSINPSSRRGVFSVACTEVSYYIPIFIKSKNRSKTTFSSQKITTLDKK